MARIRARTFLGVVVVGLVVLAFGSSLTHAASPGAPTRGDAEAVFHASLTGASAILTHNPSAQGAPRGFVASPDGVRINPLFDDLSYCAAGWHLISIGNFDDVANYASRQALVDVLSATEFRFALDGVPLEVKRTPVTPVTNPPFGIETALGVNFGAFLPPGVLTLGTHVVESTFVTPGFPDFVFDTSFTVVSC